MSDQPKPSDLDAQIRSDQITPLISDVICYKPMMQRALRHPDHQITGIGHTLICDLETPDDPDATREDWTGVTLESYARSAADVREWHAILDRKHAPKGKRKP